MNLDRIERLIKEKGWSKSEFARRIGLTQSAFNDWRLGKSSPDKHIGKICQALGTTEAYLRDETNDPRPGDQQQLDELEWAMIDGFRDLTDDDKREMLAILDLKKSKRKK